MPASGKVLEDSIRLSRIHRIKLTLYAVQAVMLVALAVLTIFVFGGATIEPYVYIPLDAFFGVLVLLLLIICLESFFFRMLELRFARSSSARHLMAKRSMKRSIMMAAVAAIVVMTMTVPSIIGGIEESRNESVYVTPGTYPPYFYSSDVLSLMETASVHVTAPRQVQVYIIVEQAFRQYYNGPDSLNTLSSYRLNTNDYITVDNELLIKIPKLDKFTRFYIVINGMDEISTSAVVTLIKEVSGTFTGVTSLLLIAFVVTNVAWVAYLIPIERKYSAGSIYR
ncbi:MAG: hypothetical protein A3K60_05400 [Euryarchaeota archaeon RBG_19FT_COMBO_56_21]|nr:MAG: hypothetical protein A3K60_05400 [Euryarchaeota archaeon RBG_19FT_COMBO_56_21]